MIQDRDYFLLGYLSQQSEPIEINEQRVPHEVRINYEFMGLTNKYPNSIYVRLHELAKIDLVKNVNGRYIITDNGRIVLEKHNQKNSTKVFAQQCDSVLSYLIQNDSSKVPSNELSQKLDIDIDTIHLIGDELKEKDLVELSITSGLYNFYLKPKAERFVRKTSFKEEKERELTTGGITNSYNNTIQNTTHGDGSHIASDNSKVETIIHNESKKKNWVEKLLDDVRNAVASHIIVSSLSLIAGAVGTKLLWPTPSQEAYPQKPLNNINVDSSNKDTTILNKRQ